MSVKQSLVFSSKLFPTVAVHFKHIKHSSSSDSLQDSSLYQWKIMKGHDHIPTLPHPTPPDHQKCSFSDTTLFSLESLIKRLFNKYTNIWEHHLFNN